MTFAGTGVWHASGSAALTVANQGIGNLMIVEVFNFSNSTVWCSSVSGGGVTTWAQAGVKFSGTTDSYSAAVFFGTVTATGAGTVTPAWSGTAPGTYELDAHEFTSTLGSWVFDVQGNLDSSGTANWPSLTATAGELYFGASGSGQAVAGSTSGYTYDASTSPNGGGLAFNPNCAGGATFPVWGDSAELFCIAVLMKEQSAGTNTSPAWAASQNVTAVAGTAELGRDPGMRQERQIRRSQPGRPRRWPSPR